MNFQPFTMSICNIYMYEQQTVHVRYHSVNVCGIIFASYLTPLNLHPLPLKTERGRKDKVHMELRYIVSSKDIERCKHMHLEINLVCFEIFP